VVAYYGSEVVGPDRRVTYLPADRWSATTPAWYVWGWQDQDAPPPERIQSEDGSRFDLAGRFPYSQLSGFNWAVYSRAP
jgi:hypothetical protein